MIILNARDTLCLRCHKEKYRRKEEYQMYLKAVVCPSCGHEAELLLSEGHDAIDERKFAAVPVPVDIMTLHKMEVGEALIQLEEWSKLYDDKYLAMELTIDYGDTHLHVSGLRVETDEDVVARKIKEKEEKDKKEKEFLEQKLIRYTRYLKLKDHYGK